MDYKLKFETPENWASYAVQDFESFLLDHASCERKASAVGMSFVVRYPDRPEILDAMIQFSREELEHFHRVFKVIQEKKIPLRADEEDAYVNLLMKEVRTGRDERFLDRLVVSSVIEARGFERLGLVTDFVEPGLKDFYARLTRAEGYHKDLFLELAHQYFKPAVIEARLDEFLTIEAAAIQAVPYRHALH